MTDRCGTHAGYQHHYRVSEPACDACRQAQADYMRQYRARNPDSTQRNNNANTTRYRALAKLAARHPTEYLTLLAAERRPPP